MKKRLQRVIAIALLALMVPAFSNCYGRFPLTRALYNFNGQIGGGPVQKRDVLQQVVFWVFVILPFYDLAILGDAIVLNLIEFWTGHTVQTASYHLDDGREVTLSPSKDGQVLTMTVTRDGQTVSQGQFVWTNSGSVQFLNQDGSLVSELSAGDLAAIAP